MSLSSRLVESLRTLSALERGASFLLAASGGLDSTVLVHLFAELRAAWDLRLTLGHVHHGIRAEAGDERVFVERLGGHLDIPVLCRHLDVPEANARTGESLQATARALRYEALTAMQADSGAAWVVTAHHADDQAETMLARFLEGAGSSGLAGIRPRRGSIIRPLLFARRAELESHAREHGIDWIEDASNTGDDYRRNAIRHHVLPVIARVVHPGFPAVAGRTAALNRSMEEFHEVHAAALEHACARPAGTGWSLAVETLKGYLEFEQLLLIRRILAKFGGLHASLHACFAIRNLIDAPAGSEYRCSTGVIAHRLHDAVSLRGTEESGATVVCVYPGQAIRTRMFTWTSELMDRRSVHFTTDRAVEFIDLDRTDGAWTLRPWVAGDAMQPLGMTGRRLVSDMLTDAHVGGSDRRAAMVLADTEGIIWLCGRRLDHRVRITDTTTRVARLTFISEQQDQA